jgi:putative oxidoreductase
MNLIQRLEFWGDRHHPRWMDIVRIALGLFLVYKGWDFLNHMSDLISVMSSNKYPNSIWYILAGHYTVFVHIAGGACLALGVFTRIACLLQIPVLLGAVFFLSTNEEMLRPYSELFLSIIVLLLLIYFSIAGNGPWSVKIKEDKSKS